jgi:hypothetical protein
VIKSESARSGTSRPLYTFPLSITPCLQSGSETAPENVRKKTTSPRIGVHASPETSLGRGGPFGAVRTRERRPPAGTPGRRDAGAPSGAQRQRFVVHAPIGAQRRVHGAWGVRMSPPRFPGASLEFATWDSPPSGPYDTNAQIYAIPEISNDLATREALTAYQFGPLTAAGTQILAQPKTGLFQRFDLKIVNVSPAGIAAGASLLFSLARKQRSGLRPDDGAQAPSGAKMAAKVAITGLGIR